jgi:XTP/dITP diphosphohydrolase
MVSCGDILLATQNPGKLGEMRQLVTGLPLRVLGPCDVGIVESPDETGHTFVENATLKARYYARRSGLLTVADDSGLSVDALDRRGARFTSAVVAAENEQVVFTAIETVEGRISEALRGSNGFGYDPLFFYPPYDKTFGEVTPQEKARVSHRGKAFARLRQYLVGRLRDAGCGEISCAS